MKKTNISSIARELINLFKSSSIYGIGNILGQVSSFFLLPVYTRYLSLKDYGILELISVTSGIIAMIIGAGIAEALCCFYYDDNYEKRQVVSTCYMLVFALGIVCFVILYFSADFMSALILDSPSFREYFLLAIYALLLGVVVETGLMYIRILDRPVNYITITITKLIMSISLSIYFLVIAKTGLVGIFYSDVIVKLVFAVALTLPILIKARLGFSWKLSKEMLKYSLPLVPSKLSRVVMNSSDRYFIKHYISISEAGLYGLSMKLGGSLHMLITSPFNMSLLPKRFEIASRMDANKVFGKVFDYYFMLMVFTGLGISVFINDILKLVTTPEYYRASRIVPLIVVSMLIFGAKYHFDFGIFYSKKTHYHAYINVLTAVTNVISNTVLIVYFGVWGAVYASLIALSLNTLLIYLVSNKLYRVDYNFRKDAKLFGTALAIYAISLLIPGRNLLVSIAAKSALMMTFPAALVYMNILSDNEISTVKTFATGLCWRLLPKRDY